MSSEIPNYGASVSARNRGHKFKDIKALLIKSLFRMVILGPSYSGKNNLVYHILKNAGGIFGHLHVICLNRDQELYDELADKLEGFITFYGANDIPPLDKIRKNSLNGIPELVIIDDFSNNALAQKKVFAEFFTRGRHYQLSTIFLSHSWFQTDVMIRRNTEYVAILKVNSKRDLKLILKDMPISGFNDDELYRAYLRATSEKGQVLFLDNVKNEARYNFNRVINPETLRNAP